MGNSIIDRYHNDSARIDRFNTIYSTILNAYSAANNGAPVPKWFQNRAPSTLAYYLEVYEHRFGTRFESFSLSQFSEFYQQVFIAGASSPVTQKRIFSLLSDYLDYLALTQVITADQVHQHPLYQLLSDQTIQELTDLERFKNDSYAKQAIDAYSQQMLFSQNEFKALISSVFKEPSQDCIARAIYVLAWCGAEPGSIPLIKKADVDLDNMIIYSTDQNNLPQNLIISTTFCRDELRRAVQASSVEIPGGFGKTREVLFVGRDEYVVRGKKGTRVGDSDPDPIVLGKNIVNNVTRVYDLRRKALSPLDPFKNRNVTVRTCYQSGCFFRLNQNQTSVYAVRQQYGSTFSYAYQKWLSYYQLNIKE